MSRLRLGLFTALCLAQLAVPLTMAYRFERTLREGALYRFRTEPFDPVDAFRGRYVAIRLRLLDTSERKYRGGEDVYAVLTPDAQGFAAVREVTFTRPKGGDWIAATTAEIVYETPTEETMKIEDWKPRTLGTRLQLTLDRYYIEESKAPEADRLWAQANRQAEATARVRVRRGQAVIEGLDVNGVPIERWVETLPPPE